MGYFSFLYKLLRFQCVDTGHVVFRSGSSVLIASLTLFGDAGRAMMSCFLRMNDANEREAVMLGFPIIWKGSCSEQKRGRKRWIRKSFH